MDHSTIEVGATILSILASALGASWHLGGKFSVIETKLQNLAEDVSLIRTNELHHIDLRFQNIERVLMEGSNVRKDSAGNT